jgi:hypothetical protein
LDRKDRVTELRELGKELKARNDKDENLSDAVLLPHSVLDLNDVHIN